jgi:hypothetical protein
LALIWLSAFASAFAFVFVVAFAFVAFAFVAFAFAFAFVVFAFDFLTFFSLTNSDAGQMCMWMRIASFARWKLHKKLCISLGS